MKDGIIRSKFNEAVREESATPAGANTLRVLGALKEVTLALREEGFEATLKTRFGATDIDDCFSRYETDRAAANGELMLGGETLPFMLWDDGYEGGDMYLRINWHGADIFSLTSTWDDDGKRWDDNYDDNSDEDENDWDEEVDEDDAETPAPAKKHAPTLEGSIADALIGVLAKIDLAQRHTVTEDEGLEKTFKIPAQIKINAPKSDLPKGRGKP